MAHAMFYIGDADLRARANRYTLRIIPLNFLSAKMLAELAIATSVLGSFVGSATASSFPAFKHLVTFGDSYSDEGRCKCFVIAPVSHSVIMTLCLNLVAYFIAHNDTLPPKGYVPPVVSGGW